MCVCAWTLKAWITPILQTLRVTIETRRWVYSPHAREPLAHDTVNVHTQTHAHTPQQALMTTADCKKTAAVRRSKRLFPHQQREETSFCFFSCKRAYSNADKSSNTRSHCIPVKWINAKKAFPPDQQDYKKGLGSKPLSLQAFTGNPTSASKKRWVSW